MNVIVIRRNRALEFTTVVTIGSREYRISVARYLEGGKKKGREGLDGFMRQLTAGASVDDCFAAMRDCPEIDPDAELAEKIESGNQELLEQVRAYLQETIERADEARRQLELLAIGEVSIVVPQVGQGICSSCGETFELHHIGGLNDVCKKCINPGFI